MLFGKFSIFRPFQFGQRGAASHSERKNRQKQPQKLMLRPFTASAAKGLSPSTVENYKTAVRSFILFSGEEDIDLQAINKEMVGKYERRLRESGVCPNTSSCYLRSLRAIYNKAVAKRKIKDKEPFRDVFTGNEKTVKRGARIQEIRRIQATEIPGNSKLSLAKDLFLFSFYTMGMPFADMAHLRKAQLKDGILAYYRRKTGKPVHVKLEKCMLEIISKYERNDSDYVFPMLAGNDTGRKRYRSYTSRLNGYNRMLKKLAEKTGVQTTLTSYVARHSWASIAYEREVGLPVIAKALGHTDTKTTLTYINEINDRKIAEANGRLLGELFFLPLDKRWKFRLNGLQM